MSASIPVLPPCSYKQPYVESGHHEIVWHGFGSVVVSAATDVRPIEGDDYNSLRELEALLTQVNNGKHAFFARVARLEFIWDERPTAEHKLRGCVLFDATGAVVVHVINALLGYDGNGPDLSRVITKALDIPDDLFAEMQEAVWNERPYVVVASRETPSHPEDGKPVVTHDEPLRDVWNWWRAR